MKYSLPLVLTLLSSALSLSGYELSLTTTKKDINTQQAILVVTLEPQEHLYKDQFVR